jgi:hypothetical protein
MLSAIVLEVVAPTNNPFFEVHFFHKKCLNKKIFGKNQKVVFSSWPQSYKTFSSVVTALVAE